MKQNSMLVILQKKCILADLGHLLGNLGKVLSFLANYETMKPRRSRYHSNSVAICLCENTIVHVIPHLFSKTKILKI